MPRPTQPGSRDPRRTSPESESSFKHKKGEIIQAARVELDAATNTVICYTAEGEQFRVEPPEYAKENSDAFDQEFFVRFVQDGVVSFKIEKVGKKGYTVVFADTADQLVFKKPDNPPVEESAVLDYLRGMQAEMLEFQNNLDPQLQDISNAVELYKQQRDISDQLSLGSIEAFTNIQQRYNSFLADYAQGYGATRGVGLVYQNYFKNLDTSGYTSITADDLQDLRSEYDRALGLIVSSWNMLKSAEAVLKADAIEVYDAALDQNRDSWTQIVGDAKNSVEVEYQAVEHIFQAPGMPSINSELATLAATITSEQKKLNVNIQEIEIEKGKPNNKDVYEEAIAAVETVNTQLAEFRNQMYQAVVGAYDEISLNIEGTATTVRSMLAAGEPADAFDAHIAQLRGLIRIADTILMRGSGNESEAMLLQERNKWQHLVDSAGTALNAYDTAHPPKTPEQISAEQESDFSTVIMQSVAAEFALLEAEEQFRNERTYTDQAFGALLGVESAFQRHSGALNDLLNVAEIDPELAHRMREKKHDFDAKIQRVRGIMREYERMRGNIELAQAKERWSQTYSTAQNFLTVFAAFAGSKRTELYREMGNTYTNLKSQHNILKANIDAETTTWVRGFAGVIEKGNKAAAHLENAFVAFDVAADSVQPFISAYIQIKADFLQQPLPIGEIGAEEAAVLQSFVQEVEAIDAVVALPKRFTDRAAAIRTYFKQQEKTAVEKVEALGVKVLHHNARGTIDATNEVVQRILGIPQQPASQKMMFVRIDAPTDPNKPYEIRIGKKQRSYAVSAHDIGELVQEGAIQMEYSPLAGGESLDRDWFADNYEGHLPFQVGERITYVLPEPYNPLDEILLVQYGQYLIFSVNGGWITLVPADSVDKSTGISSGEKIVIDRDDFMIMLGYELSPDGKEVQRTGPKSITRELENPDRLQQIIARGEPLFEEQLRDIQSPMLEIGGVARMRFRFLQNILEGNAVVVKADQWLDVHADGFNDITQIVTAQVLDARTGQPTGEKIEIPYKTYAMAVSTEGLYEHWELYRAVEIDKMRNSYEQHVVITEPLDAREFRRALIEHGVGLRSDGTFTRPESITIKVPVNGEVKPVLCTSVKIEKSQVRIGYEVDGKTQRVFVQFKSFLDHFEKGIGGNTDEAHVLFAQETAVWGQERMALFKAKYNLTDDFLKKGLSFDGQPAEFRFAAGQMRVFQNDREVSRISVDQFMQWYDDPTQPKILQLESYQHGDYFSTEWVQGLHGKSYVLLMNALVAGYDLSDFERMRNTDTGEAVHAELVSPRLVQVTQGGSTKRVALHTFLARMLGDNPEYVPADTFVQISSATTENGGSYVPEISKSNSFDKQTTADAPLTPDTNRRKRSRVIDGVLEKYGTGRDAYRAHENNQNVRALLMSEALGQLSHDLYEQWKGLLNGEYYLRAFDGSTHMVAAGRPVFDRDRLYFVDVQNGQETFISEYTFLADLASGKIAFVPIAETGNAPDTDTVEAAPEFRDSLDEIIQEFVYQREQYAKKADSDRRPSADVALETLGLAIAAISPELGAQYQAFLNGDMNIVGEYGIMEFDRRDRAIHNYDSIGVLDPYDIKSRYFGVSPQDIIHDLYTGRARFISPEENKNSEEVSTSPPAVPTLGDSSGFY